MKEYIEKEAAVENFMQYTWYNNFGEAIDDSDEKREILDDMFSDIPAADVVEVRRAAWQSWEQDKPPFKWYSCDYCGFHALSRSNYCPNCGAMMTEES